MRNKLKATQWRLGLDLLKTKTRYDIASSGSGNESIDQCIEDSSIDELWIDDWFHLERMDDDFFWIGIGNPKSGDYYHIKIMKERGLIEVHVDNQKL